jgi:hypothetical protein
MRGFKGWKEREELKVAVRQLESMLRQFMALNLAGDNSDQLASLEQAARNMLPGIRKDQAWRWHSMTIALGATDQDSSEAIMGWMHAYRSEVKNVAGDFGLPEFDQIFREERRYFQMMADALEGVLRIRGIQIEPARIEDPTQKTLSEWQEKKKAILRLERERDEELTASPEEMHPQIKRMFRKAIDAILDN